MSRLPPQHPAHAAGQLRRPARQGQNGLGWLRGMGAASDAPSGVAPPPVSTVIGSSPARDCSSLPFRAAVAVLTTFDGQAVYSITVSEDAKLPLHTMLRFRCGSRTHEPRPLWP